MARSVANILPGACYQPQGGPEQKPGQESDRRFLILAVLIEIVAVVLTVYRLLTRRSFYLLRAFQIAG